jgi:hypothetical protein
LEKIMRTQLKTGSGFKKNKNNWKRTQKSMIIYLVKFEVRDRLGSFVRSIQKAIGGYSLV